MGETIHDFVDCWNCDEEFDLVQADWCDGHNMITKICPHCGACLCTNPETEDDTNWSDAPEELVEEGFRSLFKAEKHRITNNTLSPSDDKTRMMRLPMSCGTSPNDPHMENASCMKIGCVPVPPSPKPSLDERDFEAIQEMMTGERRKREAAPSRTVPPSHEHLETCDGGKRLHWVPDGQEDTYPCPRCHRVVKRSEISLHVVDVLQPPWNAGFEWCGGCPWCDRERRNASQNSKSSEGEVTQ